MNRPGSSTGPPEPSGASGAPSAGSPRAEVARAHGHGIAVSLRLPRDRSSVPVVRHLARFALEEVGVTQDVAYDVELALSEACANVLDHADASDDYEVSITIRFDVCELRIVDSGRGFDRWSVRTEQGGLPADRGRGLGIMEAVMDRVDFRSEPERGTLVTLVKQLQFEDTPPARALLAESTPDSR